MDEQIEQAISDRTADLMSLSQVKRWAIVTTIKDQSVAEHSFAVAIIAMELAERLFQPVYTSTEERSFTEGELLWWALVHDAPEALTGDIDGKFKRDNPDVKMAIDHAEMKAMPWLATIQPGRYSSLRMLVKVADYIETTSFIQRWGTGPRCDDIYHELNANLFDIAVPNLCKAATLDFDVVERVVRDVLHHSVSESNTLQLRRHRRPNGMQFPVEPV